MKLLTFLILISSGFTLYADNITVCYHSFDYTLSNIYSVTPEVFEWQMQLILSDQIKVLSQNEMIRYCYQENSLDDPNLFITIDDGWKSVLNILPTVKNYKIPVTLYLFPHVIINNTRNYLNVDDIKYLNQIPQISYGNHSYYHNQLIGLNNEELNKEIFYSQEVLYSMLKKNLTTFAYPYGAYDAKTKRLVRNNFELAFGVFSGSNNSKTDKSLLYRLLIFKTNGFSDFIYSMDILSGGRNKKNYAVLEFPENPNNVKSNIVTLFKFPRETKKDAVLWIPGANVGPSWGLKLINKLLLYDYQAYVYVPGINNISLMRTSAELILSRYWGIAKYMDDLRTVIDYITMHHKRLIIITAEDGYDSLMALLANNQNLQNPSVISEIIALNPSVLNNSGSIDYYNEKIIRYNDFLKMRYTNTPIYKSFLMLKTLSELMVLKPDGQSPFAPVFGVSRMTNREMYFWTSQNKRDLESFIGQFSSRNRLQDIRMCFMSPLPAYSMVKPLNLLIELNNLWYNNFIAVDAGITEKDKVKFPVLFFYTIRDYEPNINRIKKVFPSLNIKKEFAYDSQTTIDMLLSDLVTNTIVNQINF